MTVYRPENPMPVSRPHSPRNPIKKIQTIDPKFGDKDPVRAEKSENHHKSSVQATEELSLGDKQQLLKLQSRDRQVRNHEQAHLAAAGGVARGGASLIYMTGPDGKRYAIGGEVAIDTSPVPGNPEKTIFKAQIIRRAALAPATPSPQDRRVASAATRMEQIARAELAGIKLMEKQARTAETGTEPVIPGEEAENEAYRAPVNISSNRAGQFYAAAMLKSDDYTQMIDVFA